MRISMVIEALKGSIFSLSCQDADGLAIFIPCGCTAIRGKYERFILSAECVRKAGHEITVYKNAQTGQVIVAWENPRNEIPGIADAKRMVEAVLEIMKECSVKRVAMNGVRFAVDNQMSWQERELFSWVSGWCQANRNAFERITLVDLRGGFSFLDAYNERKKYSDFFTDRWPMKEEEDFWRAIDSFDVVATQNAYADLQCAVDRLKDVDDGNEIINKAVIKREIGYWPSMPVCVPDGMQPCEVIDFAKFMMTRGASIRYVVYEACVHLVSVRSLTESQIAGCVALMKWAVENGASPNASFGLYCHTGLDVFDDHFKNTENDYDREYRERLKDVREFIVRLGVKHVEELLPKCWGGERLISR